MKFSSKTVVTIGNFDGLHIGHRKLIETTLKVAEQKNALPVVFTFQNHPLEFLYDKKIEYITSPVKKLELLEQMGINDVVSIPFNNDIKNMSTEQFSKEVLIDTLNSSDVIMGFDSRLGSGREGKVEYLYETGKDMGFDVHIVPPVLVEGMRVSSSFIRELIRNGEVKRTASYLGREHEIEGTVIHGKKIGRELGFPTANLELTYPVLLPKKGVYYCKILIDSIEYDAAASVGNNPTVKDKGFSVEAHVLGVDMDMYGKTVTLIFKERLRDEMKFNSLQELKFQMDKDVLRIKNYIFT